MRNLVAKNDHNRSSVHPDRTKRPPNTVDEGLLDYYAENAVDVAQDVYDNPEVKKAKELLERGDNAKDIPLSGRAYKEACDRVVLSRSSENHKVKLFLGDQEIKGFADGASISIVPEAVDWDNCMVGKNEDGEIEIYEGPENDLLAFLETFHDCAR